MSLTFLGHSAVRFHTSGLNVYVDPFFRDPVDRSMLPKGDIVLFSHGHFDHGVQSAPELFEQWQCTFVAPKRLVQWMTRKFKKRIPQEAMVAVNHEETIELQGLAITAVPAHHPVNRLGKTMLALFARSSAPGKPVNGYLFDGFYHSGDTIYSPAIKDALKNRKVHTACLPIGGKYAVAAPKDALRIALEIGATRLVPLHWQPLMQQVPFRFQSSDLVKLVKQTETSVKVHALAIGEVLEDEAPFLSLAQDSSAFI